MTDENETEVETAALILGFLLFMWLVVGDALSRYGDNDTVDQLLFSERDTDLENGHFQRDGNTGGYLYADGYAFEMRNMGGHLHWREVEPNSGVPLERWITPHPKDAAIYTEPKVMSMHIKMRVNRRKGIGL